MGYNWGAGASGAMTGAKIGSAAGLPGAIVGGLAGAGMGFFGGGGDDEEDTFIPPPDYYLSQYYQEPQKELTGIYGDILSGELDPYYAPIGEFGGDAFDQLMQDIEGRVTTGVTRSVEEDITRRGVARGGLGTTAISMGVAEKIGDIEATLGYQDYGRALEARGDLLGLGLGGKERIRGAGLSESELRNKFNLDVYRSLQGQYAVGEAEDEATSDIWGDIASEAGQIDWGKLFGKTKIPTNQPSIN